MLSEVRKLEEKLRVPKLDLRLLPKDTIDRVMYIKIYLLSLRQSADNADKGNKTKEGGINHV